MAGLNQFYKYLHDFLVVYLPTEKKSSVHTIRSYKKSLELFIDFIKEKKSISLSEVTFQLIDKKLVVDFLIYLEEIRNCNPSTRNQRLNCIRAFYKYCAAEDIALVSYYEEINKIPMVKQEDNLTQYMSQKAIETILRQPDASTLKGKRDAFLMLFLYKTGARVQELVDIQIKDIKFDSQSSVLLHGKGKKVRSIPIRDSLLTHLKKYFSYFHKDENLYSSQYLFYTIRNGTKKRMTEDNVRQIVKKYGTKAREQCKEVPQNVHPHLFRHSCAMSLYQNGVDLTLISQWLGHSNFETTLIYAKADTEMKRKALERSIPKDSPLKEILDYSRYTVDDDELLKRLCGIK